MIRINGSLVVSVVKWSSDPPLHEVSAILCSPDGRDLVSASIDGNMILWSIDSNAEFKPKWMISGHRSHVKNLCLAGVFQSENRKLFFSHSATSEMALWDWNNGKCLEFKIDTRYRHTHIKSHQPTFLDYRLLFCCGQYPHIVIIHATSLVVLFNLTSQSKPDWISNFAVVSHPNRQHEVVLGVSASNVAALWTLNGDEVQDETKYEHESLVIDCLSPIVQVDCCSQTPRCILMVSSFGWQLFDAMVCSVALLQPTTKQDPLVGGEFVGSDSVVVYCRSGVALLYRIEMRHQAEPSAPLSFEPPVLLMRFLPPTNGDDIVSSENGFCQFSVIHTSNLPVLLGGTLNGEILRWNLADEPKTGTHSPVDKYPNIITGLVDVWRRNPPHPFLRNPSCEITNDVRAPEPSVTVCIQLFRTSALKPRDTRPHRVAFGLSDGSIIVMRLTDFMQAAYWTSDFRANSNTPNANHLLHLTRFKLTGHVGPVTSLLHPASADTQFIHTLDHDSTITKCPYDWDHLVSGGADFTVRLWDLDPWREAGLDRVQDRRNRLLSDRLASCITPPTCLSVFHCHSSPCISLFIGPPTCAVLSSCAGNSRLNSCVGSVGSDGSVSIISLHEQRVLLSTSPPCKLSPSPVIALGWRVPEDLLLVVHADWGLEIWDIASGILDRYETDQTAKELFEQAHFVVELRTPPPSFIRCVPPMSDHAAPVATDGIATCTFFGNANYSASAASLVFSAPPRLRRSSRLHGTFSDRRFELSSVQLQAVGTALPSARSPRSSAEKLHCGAAALVFHWDLESIIAVILSQNEKKEMSETSCTHVDVASQFQLLQILMSLIHPWGRDTCADDALRDCCGFVKPQIEEVEDLQRPPPRLHSTTCLGLLSKHGCLAINFPGWSCLNPESVSGFSQLHSLNRFINAGLLLAELSLAETITSLSSTYLARLFEWRRYPVAGSTRHSLSNSDTDSHHLICNSWVHLAHRICTSLLASIVLPFNTTQPACICLPELEFFVHRWQDRSLPIRYAARTILLTLLDQMSPQVRKQVATYWTNLLPSFSLAQPTNQHRDTSISIHPAAPSTVVNGDLTRPSDPHFHKPQPINKLNIPKDSSDSPLTRRFSIDPPASPERQVPRTSELPPSNDPLPITESVSLCSLDAVAGNSIPPVPDSHWWLTLNGYRISAREHARLQATAVVILAVIGSRYCSHVRHWHPAVFARDLTSDTGPSHIQAESGCNDDDNRTHGLAMPCFESPDSGCSTTTIRASNRLRLTLDQLSEVTALQPEVSGIFGVDDYRLARSVSQCLIALLLNRAPLLDGTSPHRDARPPSAISQPGFVPNRCGRLFNNTEATTLAHLMSNPNGSLRRAAIDLLGKGFVVWEPYSDLGQVINGLLSLVAGTETLLSSLPRWLPIPDHNDLVRTAREALWAITFARPKAVTLNLSLEVRRSGSQLNAAASSAANATNRSESLSRSSSVSSGGLSSQVLHKNAAHRGSATTPALTEHRNPKMVVMMSSPAVATPIFTPSTGNAKNIPANYTGSELTSGLTNPCPPIFSAREEIVPLFEQLCARCASEIVSVLPEVVEVVLACLDRIRLKERGLEFLFPTFRQFSALSSHTRIHKVCVGGVNGSLTFFDFKLGRYLVTPGHKGPVTAVRFQADGRLVATYSLSEGLLRIWQLHTAGLFGMGGQQVKAISSHPVPPLQGPLKHASDASSSDADETPATHISTDRLSVWLDWPESRVVQIVTKRGVQRHINL